MDKSNENALNIYPYVYIHTLTSIQTYIHIFTYTHYALFKQDTVEIFDIMFESI